MSVMKITRGEPEKGAFLSIITPSGNEKLVESHTQDAGHPGKCSVGIHERLRGKIHGLAAELSPWAVLFERFFAMSDVRSIPVATDRDKPKNNSRNLAHFWSPTMYIKWRYADVSPVFSLRSSLWLIVASCGTGWASTSGCNF